MKESLHLKAKIFDPFLQSLHKKSLNQGKRNKTKLNNLQTNYARLKN